MFAPVTVLLQVAGNILPGEISRARAHLVQYLARYSFVHTQPFHSHYELVMQFPGPLNLHYNRQHISMQNVDGKGHWKAEQVVSSMCAEQLLQRPCTVGGGIMFVSTLHRCAQV